jgi:hypothetical protein
LAENTIEITQHGAKMTIEAKVIEDSISLAGERITTLQIKFHRYILPEFNTHRVFSRNFSSSRAIPTAKLIEQVRLHPAMPVHWGKNQPGMQADVELEGQELALAKREWRVAAHIAADTAEIMAKIGMHKQNTNRIIEPFMWVTGIVTSTEWDNFFELRAHEDAQPEIHELAIKMRDARDNSIPQLLKEGEWHLPYVSEAERNDQFFKLPANVFMLQKISAARCCRVSYLKHDGSLPNVDDDLALFQRLAGAEPQHLSPTEHQATPNYTASHSLEGNFRGWNQFRHVIQI